MKFFIKLLFAWLFKVEVRGWENLPAKDSKGLIIISNHVSLLDGMFIELFIPIPKTFLVDTIIARNRLNKFFLRFCRFLTVDFQSPFAMKSIMRGLSKGENCMIFPEGRVSVTGGLMRIQPGTGIIADRGNYELLPIFIEGPQYSNFSYLSKKNDTRLFPKVTISIGKPFKVNSPNGVTKSVKRQVMSMQIHRKLEETALASSPYASKTIPEAIVFAAKRHGRKRVIVEDIRQDPINYGRILTGMFALGGVLQKNLANSEFVGLMLPNSNAFVVTCLALKAYGRAPAMINFSSGEKSIRACVTSSQIKEIITSRTFIEKGGLENLITSLEKDIRFIYLEDLATKIGTAVKILSLCKSFFPSYFLSKYRQNPDGPGLVLFTSGSEDMPKGVVLSDSALLANVRQSEVRIGLTHDDYILNTLPVFHCFGLTVCTFLPLICGVRVFMYPSPLHYRIIPRLAYEKNATILVGTDTFYFGYARKAETSDFRSVRLAVAGAEKLQDRTKQLYQSKFGLKIYEGYGMTEAAPVVSVNTIFCSKDNSVGLPVGGIETKLEEVPGVNDSMKLLVKGPNLMLGYLKVDKPGILQKTESEFYDTGDLVEVDPAGFITIKGRAKRFVKIGGEMVSLVAVENIASIISPDHLHATVSIRLAKGETIILATTDENLSRAQFVEYIRGSKDSELLIPRKIVHLKEIPLLGSGKTNYPELTSIIADQISQ